MREKITRTLGAVALLGVAGTAYAGGSGGTPGQITSGDATYTFLGFDSNGSANWTPGGDLDGNQLFQSWWWFRADNQTSETSIGNGLPDTTVYSGDTATFSGAEEAVGLDYEMTWTVNGVNNSLTSRLTVTNTTDDPIVLNIFNYADVDINGSQGDSAEVDANNNIFIQDAGTPGTFIRYSGSAPDAYQVEVRADILNSLNDDEVTNLNNQNNVTTPADFTAGFQWIDIIVAPGNTETFTIGFTVIPAPGAASALAIAGLAATRHRRR